ncbi:hypothetical protein HN358_00615 [Candidatus Uhrbacteria bacterium]|jgi:hypothetical protein|nr:hypothetical protein [Candidatus Uhrbacteria bacterium]MBT7717387.1 hypothetical protein [Candidatus Uhrbacteria bacterium]
MPEPIEMIYFSTSGDYFVPLSETELVLTDAERAHAITHYVAWFDREEDRIAKHKENLSAQHPSRIKPRVAREGDMLNFGVIGGFMGYDVVLREGNGQHNYVIVVEYGISQPVSKGLTTYRGLEDYLNSRFKGTSDPHGHHSKPGPQSP